MPAQTLDFYFDYISSYAYIAWWRINRSLAERDVELVYRPVLFAGLLNHWGQLGPAEIPPKREFVCKDGLRLSAVEGFPFVGPRYHPFHPLYALRVSLPEVAGDQQKQVVDALWHGGWGRGMDYGDPDDVVRCLDEAGLDGAALLDRAGSEVAKEALKQSTADAVSRGVFGVPTFMVGDELVWGSDRIAQVLMLLDGEDPIDHERLQVFLARPGKASRR